MILSGHVDAISIRGAVAHILDHKTGRKDALYRQQALGYCALVLLEHPELEEATCTILWIRDLQLEEYRMPRAELGPWLNTLRETVIEWDGVWHPGTHCEHCPQNHQCPAASALARRDVAALSNLDLDDGTLDALTNEQWIDLIELAGKVTKLGDRVRGLAKTRVLQHGDISDGKRRLTIVTEERRSLDPLKAFPVLEAAGFADDDMAQVITMSASKAEDVVFQRAPKGDGAAAKRELREQLEAAEAIQVTEIQKLTQRRA